MLGTSSSPPASTSGCVHGSSTKHPPEPVGEGVGVGVGVPAGVGVGEGVGFGVTVGLGVGDDGMVLGPAVWIGSGATAEELLLALHAATTATAPSPHKT